MWRALGLQKRVPPMPTPSTQSAAVLHGTHSTHTSGVLMTSELPVNPGDSKDGDMLWSGVWVKSAPVGPCCLSGRVVVVSELSFKPTPPDTTDSQASAAVAAPVAASETHPNTTPWAARVAQVAKDAAHAPGHPCVLRLVGCVPKLPLETATAAHRQPSTCTHRCHTHCLFTLAHGVQTCRRYCKRQRGECLRWRCCL
jgi:hypothetical protein